MASIKKGSRRIQSVRVLTCSRCGLPTTHTLYDTENKVYKCTICGSTIKFIMSNSLIK